MGRHYRTGKTAANRFRRWAPLEPLGEIAGSLFGLTPAKETRRLKEAVNNVIDDLTEQRTVLQNTLLAINDTQEDLINVHRTVHTLRARAKETRTKVDELLHNQTELQNQNIHIHTGAAAEALLSAIEFYHTQARLFDMNYLHLRDMAEIGHLTEELVNTSLLRSILHDIRSPLSLEYVYTHTNVRLMQLTENSTQGRRRYFRFLT